MAGQRASGNDSNLQRNHEEGRQPLQLVGATNANFAKSWAEALVILLVAVFVIGGLEAWVRIQDVPAYTFPRRARSGSRSGTTSGRFTWITSSSH